ncbi:protein lin-52 homolog isoform 2-T3 [Dama dama]|uniref:protein lin-52 homolog isoform X2 n=1 Tax=Dama dama TaxID=30532 RepID=UPI002A35B4FB|nr:protein lin-52 homolog isoform X2 [Dama dama]XP_061012655.1 protein lin-52 homolog isoform X2 [Dama dama]
MGAGRRTRLLGLRVEFLFGGVAYGSKLSRRRLATSRDMGWKMASPTDGADLEASLLSFEKLDRASPDLWPEQLPGVAEFAASFKSPITSSPPKWMAEIERDDIDMLKELGSLTTANLMEKVRGLQNLAYQLGLDEWELPDPGINMGSPAFRADSLPAELPQKPCRILHSFENERTIAV